MTEISAHEAATHEPSEPIRAYMGIEITFECETNEEMSERLGDLTGALAGLGYRVVAGNVAIKINGEPYRLQEDGTLVPPRAGDSG